MFGPNPVSAGGSWILDLSRGGNPGWNRSVLRPGSSRSRALRQSPAPPGAPATKRSGGELEADREQRLEIAVRAVVEAQASSRSKDEFLAMLGHELELTVGLRNAVAAARMPLR